MTFFSRVQVRWDRVIALVLAMLLAAGWLSAVSAKEEAGRPGAILLDVRGGLAVILGEDSAEKTRGAVALRTDTGSNYLVESLYTNAAAMAAARASIRKSSLAGSTTVSLYDGRTLPYVDDLVSVVIVGAACTMPDAGREILRVLSPRGTAVVKEAGNEGWLARVPAPVSRQGGYARFRKPVPDDIDEWTHFLRDADNNAVARDKRVGLPRRTQWIGGPKWARNHNHLSSVSAVVSAEGRMFAIVDEGPVASLALPPEWKLVARDAFNGVVLWKRPVGPWEGHLRTFRSGPTDLARGLVAVGDHVYLIPGYGKAVQALQAKNGETLRTYKGTEGALEILHVADALYVLAGDRDPKAYASALKKAMQSPFPDNKRLLRVDCASGKITWRRDDAAAEDMMPCTLCVSGGRVYFHNPRELVCADAQTGKTIWSKERPLRRHRLSWSTPTLVVSDGVVLSADVSAGEGEAGAVRWTVSSSPKRGDPMGELIAYDAADGREMWRCPTADGYTSPPDVFVINGFVWGGQAPGRNTTDFTEGRDLRTGEIKRRLQTDHVFDAAHHHRCYRNKATEDFIILGRTGVEFIDLDGKDHIRNCWVRSACQYGIMPANGLLYVAPHACACYIQSKLSGFWALAAGKEVARLRQGYGGHASGERLEKGPAYDSAIPQSQIRNSQSAEWPTLRHDAGRSGATPSRVPARPGRIWAAKLGGKLSSPVVAGGRLVVASVDAHSVHAIDAKTGRRLWDFAAGGRIDSPPTIHGGRVLFGSADGYVYSLRLSDGKLAWRYLAAHADRRTVSFGQVESLWPVTGSVLVDEGVLYCTAGRSSYLDGGMVLCRLDPATGREISRTVLEDRDPATGFEPEDEINDVELPGALPDVLVSDGEYVYLRDRRFDRDLKEHPPTVPHMYCSAGLLDDSWWHRTYWLWGERTFGRASGWHVIPNFRPSGRILVADEKTVFGYGRKAMKYGGYSLGASHLFRASKQVKPVAKKLKNNNKALAELLTPARVQYLWTRESPLFVRALVLAGENLVAAGPTSKGGDVAFDNPETDAVLMVFSAADGSTRSRCELPAQPVFDGMAAAVGRIYVATISGELLCFGQNTGR